MSTTDKTIGHGTTLSWAGTTIAKIVSITPPPKAREDVEALTLDSSIQDKLPSDPPDMGQLTAVIAHKPGATNDELLDTAFDNRTVAEVVITYPASVGKKDTFSAYVLSISPATVESKTMMTRTVVFTVTTAIVRANA